jgi:chromate transporter
VNSQLLGLLAVFSLLSIMAIGGGTAVLPEMKKLTVEERHWLTNDQFRDVYSIGQLAPGPNMLMVSVIGFKVAGFTGGLVAFVAFFAPCCLIAWGTSRAWDHFSGSPWRLSIQHGMAPLVIGLMLAGTIAVARTAIFDVITVVIAALSFAGLYFLKKVNPALLILGGAVAGWLFLR